MEMQTSKLEMFIFLMFPIRIRLDIISSVVKYRVSRKPAKKENTQAHTIFVRTDTREPSLAFPANFKYRHISIKFQPLHMAIITTRFNYYRKPDLSFARRMLNELNLTFWERNSSRESDWYRTNSFDKKMKMFLSSRA